ncbi:MAG: CHAD domain-containing protein, partial [Terriglobales bacterium]
MSEFSNAAAATAPAPDHVRHDEPAKEGHNPGVAEQEPDAGHRPALQPDPGQRPALQPDGGQNSDAGRSPVLQQDDGESTAPKEAEPVDAWKKVRKLALKQLDRFVALGPKVLRGDDPDAIHDLRVASRRLQQVLDLIYPPPRPGEIRKLRRKIRRCRRTLGEVRNCDVQLARVGRTLASKRTARREIWEAVSHYLHQQRARHFERSFKKLSKVNLAVFYVHLRSYLVPDGAASRAPQLEPMEAPTADQFYARVGESLENVWQALETQIAESHRDPKMSV